MLDGEGNQASLPIPNPGASPGKTSPVFFDLNAYAEAEGWAPQLEGIQIRAVFDAVPSKTSVSGASAPATVTYSRFAGGSADATEGVGPATVDLDTGSFTISRTDVSIPVPGSEANLEFTRTYNSAYGANEKSNSRIMGPMWQPSSPVESEYEEEAWQKLLVRHEDAVPAQYEQCSWDEEAGTESCGQCAEGSCGEPCGYYNEETGVGCERWMTEAAIPE